MRPALVCVTLLLAGCASTPEAPATAADPLDPQWPTPQPQGLWGRFDIRLTATAQDDHAPADVLVSLRIRPLNAVGEDIAADVSWGVEGAGVQRAGQGRAHEETLRLGRGTHAFTAWADAPGFIQGHAQASLTVAPPPLVASVDAIANATKGEWVDLSATAYGGYSDQGTDCTWHAEDGALEDASSCQTRVRWFVSGNRTVVAQVRDGSTAASAVATVRVLPPEPVPRPTSVPAGPLLSDPSGPSADEPHPPHADVVAAWFEHNVDVLHVALAVQDASTAAAAARAVTYSVSFEPSWNMMHEEDRIGRLRVVSTWSHDDGLPDGLWSSTLQGLRSDAWVDLAPLAAAPPGEGSIVWWTVPRADLQVPFDGGLLMQVAAEARAHGSVADEAVSTAAYVMQ